MSVIDYSWDFSKDEFSFDLDFFNEKDQEDKMWQARTGLNYETLCGAIETIIFMSDKPVTLQKIKTQIDSDLPLRVVHESIARLQQEYEAKHHGIRLMEVAQGYQFRTKATYSKIIQNMFKVSSFQLSPTALEVLAIIAYKQPISKTAVETVRGVDSSHIIRALMDKRLVKVVGRSDEVGRPSVYGTTSEFLEVFNLNTVEELPSESELDDMASASEVAAISEIKDIVQTGEKKRFDFDELEELDKLATEIANISSDTLFTQELSSSEKARKKESTEEKKSAFDILEDYLDRKDTIEQNMAAMDSEAIMNAIVPKVVDVTQTDALLNAPELFDDEDDAQSIDETFTRELPLPAEDKEFAQEEINELVALNEQIESISDQAEELIEESKIDPQELAEAFDEAFDSLFATEDASDINTKDEENSQVIESHMEELDGLADQVVQKASELDIDLAFLNENEDNSKA